MAIIFCAILLGGLEASGGLLQRRLGLPDATTLILEGLLFTNLLLWEALSGRLAAWKIRLAQPQPVVEKGALQRG